MHPQDHPSFLSQDAVERELSTARIEVDRLLAAVRGFTVIAHDAPWLHLEDVLMDLRRAATTVAVLEQVVASSA